MGTTHIVVDGSNIATEGRSLPSLQQLLEAVAAVAKDQKPDTITVIVDATFGHRIDKDEREAYDAKVSNGEIITPPAGVIGRGDAFILEVADRADAVVLSNDSFQEFHGDYRWLFDEGRLLGGKHVPGVGWIFLDRSPVRGPASRKATSAAKKKRKEAPKKEQRTSQKASKGQRKASGGKDGSSSKSSTKTPAKASARTSSQSSGKEPEPYNDLMPFLDFVGANEVGSVVTGEVEQFSSHGAYVMVGDTRCYVALKALGDPPPRSARDVLTQGESRSFRVEAIDTPRRGIDLSLVDATSDDAATVGEDEAPVGDASVDDTSVSATSDPGVTETPSETLPVEDDVPVVTEADLDDPNLSVSQRRKLRAALAAQQSAEAAPAETTPAKKATAKKATAKKSTTKKATAKKAAAKKATTTAKKAATKKATAKKATTKKATAKKAATKKATAKKAATKKVTTTAKKAAAKKATVKKAGAKKAGAKKAVAKKAVAKKATAKKTAAKKSAATKAAGQSSARKSSPRPSED